MLVSSQCCSAYALLKSRLTSTFLVGSAAQAQRLVYEDVRRNWELVSSRCGVVLGDDGTTVLGVCQLQLRSDKYGTMAWVRSCLPVLLLRVLSHPGACLFPKVSTLKFSGVVVVALPNSAHSKGMST